MLILPCIIICLNLFIYGFFDLMGCCFMLFVRKILTKRNSNKKQCNERILINFKHFERYITKIGSNAILNISWKLKTFWTTKQNKKNKWLNGTIYRVLTVTLMPLQQWPSYPHLLEWDQDKHDQQHPACRKSKGINQSSPSSCTLISKQEKFIRFKLNQYMGKHNNII